MVEPPPPIPNLKILDKRWFVFIKHLYEKVVYVVEGLGSTEVWMEGQSRRFFEWGAGSLFAPPLNCWYRLINGGRQRALLAAVSNAPRITAVTV